MRKLFLIALVILIALVAVVPALAHNAGPCEDTDDPGHSEYAQHHISFLAKQGGIGGDGHVPGTHQGFSACNPGAG